MRFNGKVVSKDGSETIVKGDYQIKTTPGGLTGWSGSFPPPGSKHLGVGDYQLVLDDGRSAYILILRVSSGSGRATVAEFKGNGPPP